MKFCQWVTAGRIFIFDFVKCANSRFERVIFGLWGVVLAPVFVELRHENKNFSLIMKREQRKGMTIGMTRKSMGEFMAVLRKANGMTQREVADRLSVSDKAVSRWERDECAPDISLIPAIAELYGVTCDELLKGERIMELSKIEYGETKTDKKVEKQLRALVNRSLSNFKTLIWISLALSLVGLICMFGISYGFYRPTIGFAVMLLFEVVAFVMVAIAVNKLKEKKTDNELFEYADEMLVQKFYDTLGHFSFIAFFSVFAVILISLPLICFTSSYVQSVLPIGSYFLYFSVIITLVLMLVFSKVKMPYLQWITEQSMSNVQSSDLVQNDRKELDISGKKILRKMTLLQMGAVVFASILFVIAPYFEVANPYEISYVMIGINIVGLVLLALDIILFIIFLIVYKNSRRYLVLPAIRNVLMIPSALLCSMWHSVGFVHMGEIIGSEDTTTAIFEKYDIWYSEYLYMAFGWAILVVVVFALFEIVLRRKHRIK